MTKKYLLIGVVTIAGLLMVTAILTANTRSVNQPNPLTVTEKASDVNTPVPTETGKPATVAKTNMAKAVLDVEGMSCSGCIYTIKSGTGHPLNVEYSFGHIGLRNGCRLAGLCGRGRIDTRSLFSHAQRIRLIDGSGVGG